ncbi:MAG: hypothetical protein FJW23_12020 [Acidimicrobiia bacterium]|nr:hypothetical protein [Acidimicrobiia bacterium]
MIPRLARAACGAPAPDSPAIHKIGADLASVLDAAKPNAAGMFSSNVTANDQYRIGVIRRQKAAGALAHAGNTELLHILEGEGTRRARSIRQNSWRSPFASHGVCRERER